MCIWGARGAEHNSLHDIHSFLIVAKKDRVGHLKRQMVRHIAQLLDELIHFRLRRDFGEIREVVRHLLEPLRVLLDIARRQH